MRTGREAKRTKGELTLILAIVAVMVSIAALLSVWNSLQWAAKEAGRVTDAEEEPAVGIPGEPNAYGSYTVSVYDEAGRVTEKIFLDAASDRAYGEQGVSCICYRYDEAGHLCSQAFYDTQDRPMENIQGTASIATATLDGGTRTRETRYGADGRKEDCCLGWCVRETLLGANGLPVEISYEDRDGSSCEDIHGVTRILLSYDQKDRLTAVDFQDGSGQSVLAEGDIAGCRLTYSSDGRIRVRFVNRAGDLCPCSLGYAVCELRTDRTGKPLRIYWYDTQGNPVDTTGAWPEVLQDLGLPETNVGIDEGETRCKVTLKYRNGEPSAKNILRTDGSILRYTYDETQRRRASYDSQGAWHTGQSSLVTVWTLNEAGDCILQQTQDAAGSLLAVESGIAQTKFERDAFGRVTCAVTCDPAGQPVADETGVAGRVYTYDAYGGVSTVEYLDESGSPTAARDGCARVVTVRDNRGNILRQESTDLSGSPVIRNGYWAVEKEYDVYGNAVKISYYDGTGSRTAPDYLGYAIQVSTYDKHGRELESCTYDAGEQPCLRHGEYFRRTYAYDSWGNCVKLAFYTTEERLSRPILWMTYDADGHLLEEKYTDGAGNLLVYGLYARRTETWDTEKNRICSVCYYGADGELMVNRNEGFAWNRTEYDDEEGVYITTYFDTEGNVLWTHTGGLDEDA